MNTYVDIELRNAPRGASYTFGIWQDTDQGGVIFGLGTSDGRMTHMVYGADYADPAGCLDHARKHGGFWFDAGRDLHCTPEELERCMTAVGLIEPQP